MSPASEPTGTEQPGESTDGTGQTAAAQGPSKPAITVHRLWHSFGGAPVLRDVTFSVAPGEIFGFIGPNGAGKTTTIRILATLLEPSAGRVEIEGLNVTVDPDRVRRLIGYMPDHAGVYERITVVEYLEFFAAACDIPGDNVVDAVIELTDLVELRHRLVASLSKGMRQRLGLARVLLHDPRVLIMDEPASDLDPRARIEIRDLLLELKELGKTIFLSSHILSELSDVCTSVAIIEKGRLLVSGPISELAALIDARRAGASRTSSLAEENAPRLASGAEPVSAAEEPATGASPPGGEASLLAAHESSRPPLRRLEVRVLGDPQLAIELTRAHPLVKRASATPQGLLALEHRGDDRTVAELVATLVRGGVGVVAVEPERRELERIFLEVTEGKLQ